MDEHTRSEDWFDPTDPVAYNQMRTWLGLDRSMLEGDVTSTEAVRPNVVSPKKFALIAVPFAGILLLILAYQYITMLVG